MSKFAYLFPGQASQYVGMGRALCQVHPEAEAVFAEADEALGIPLSQICFDGPEEVLTDTINAQPAILTASVAALEVMKAQSLFEAPAFVAGHSMGEFSALVGAGALGFADALTLVRERGRLMKLAGEKSPGGMAAVIGLDVETLTQICEEAGKETGGVIQVANDNCPGQIVISGDQMSLAKALERAETAGARKVVQLAVSIAAHTPLMAVIADEFASAVEKAPIVDPMVPLIANVSATPIMDEDSIRCELKTQLTSGVRWAESMRYLVAQGVTQVVEVGPKDVLTGLMRRIDRKVDRQNIGDAALA